MFLRDASVAEGHSGGTTIEDLFFFFPYVLHNNPLRLNGHARLGSIISHNLSSVIASRAVMGNILRV